MDVRTRSAPITGVSFVSAEKRAPLRTGANRDLLSAYICRMKSVISASSSEENEKRRTRSGDVRGVDIRASRNAEGDGPFLLVLTGMVPAGRPFGPSRDR